MTEWKEVSREEAIEAMQAGKVVETSRDGKLPWCTTKIEESTGRIVFSTGYGMVDLINRQWRVQVENPDEGG